jgi:hypothetical protein
MSMSRPYGLALAVAVLLSGCSFTDDTLQNTPEPQSAAPAPQAATPPSSSQRFSWLPTLTAPDPRGDAASGATPSNAPPPQPAPVQSAPVPAISAPETGRPPSAASTTSTSTVAIPASANRPAAVRNDLLRLQDDVAQHLSELRHLRAELDDQTGKVDALAGGIEMRLKSKSVPNDPQLLGDWNQAETQLNRTAQSVARLNNISNWATTDAALASYVQQAIRAAQSDPGISEADRRQLVRLAGDADHTSIAVDQLVTETSGEIANRNLFVATAHRRLAAIESDIAAGQRAASVASLPRGAGAAASSGAPSERRALVTIRFDHPNVAYQEELFRAMRAALDRQPGVAFDIVAVSPPGAAGTNAAAAERNVESVVQSLSGMGLPPDRFRLSAETLADASGNEIRIYPR